MKRKHEHSSSLEIECEKCGGEVEVINPVFPRSYECVCKNCKHEFTWVSAKEE